MISESNDSIVFSFCKEKTSNFIYSGYEIEIPLKIKILLEKESEIMQNYDWKTVV